MTALTGISQEIWDMKYRLKAPDGTPLDETIEDTWRRVATALAVPEAVPAVWVTRFYEAMEGFKFIPAGRILAGAGSGRDVTLFNCFVMGTIPDSLDGIFSHLREAALTMQQGGGIGYDFSTLRPKGAPVVRVAADASGPLSFMDVWDAMCRTIMSAGTRRGAMMATMRCDHPDIEAFVAAKGEAGRLRMFNLSVLATDAFMASVAADGPWDLVFDGRVYRTISARALWDAIMRATYAYAEPGVIFIDRVNARNNLSYCEDIFASNPCGEQMLPPYGACLLGSINLAALVKNIGLQAGIDEWNLRLLVGTAVRMLDNVIEVSRFALPQQEAEAKAKRRIGLGVTGLADALLMCGLRYGSPQAVSTMRRWLRLIERSAYLASTALANQKGAFPLYDRERYLAGEHVAGLDDDVRAAIAEHGMRNSHLTSIAPTGTISLLAGNVSGGIEPVFSWRSVRRVLQPDGRRVEQAVEDYAYRLYREMHGTDAALPDYFVDAQSLAPADHLAMQAAAQRHVDSSISKTINVPEHIEFERFKDLYAQAYAQGCKGCTTYRPNAVTGSVLSVAADAPAPPADETSPPGAAIVHLTQPLERPEELVGATYKMRWPDSDHALYVTLNDIVQDGPGGQQHRRPFEIFINSKNMEHYAWIVGLTRMISAVFRRGGDVAFVVEEMKAIFDPRGGAWQDGRYVPSILAAIGAIIERHLVAIGFLAGPEDAVVRQVINLGDDGWPSSMRQCPKCGAAALIRAENCDRCTSCDYSKC